MLGGDLKAEGVAWVEDRMSPQHHSNRLPKNKAIHTAGSATLTLTCNLLHVKNQG